MSHDAFITYSTHDKAVADATCAALEAAGIRCWIAPRDITPGAEWGEAIIDGINHCRVMILIFSASANDSPADSPRGGTGRKQRGSHHPAAHPGHRTRSFARIFHRNRPLARRADAAAGISSAAAWRNREIPVANRSHAAANCGAGRCPRGFVSSAGPAPRGNDRAGSSRIGRGGGGNSGGLLPGGRRPSRTSHRSRLRCGLRRRPRRPQHPHRLGRKLRRPQHPRRRRRQPPPLSTPPSSEPSSSPR